MSKTHHWRICIRGAYQRMTERKKPYFLFLVEFWALCSKTSAFYEKMHAWKYLFFPWSFALFRHVTDMSKKYQKISVLLVFEPTQHKTTFLMTFWTKHFVLCQFKHQQDRRFWTCPEWHVTNMSVTCLKNAELQEKIRSSKNVFVFIACAMC